MGAPALGGAQTGPRYHRAIEIAESVAYDFNVTGDDLTTVSDDLAQDRRRVMQLAWAALGLTVAGVLFVVTGRVVPGCCVLACALAAAGTAIVIRSDTRRLLTALVAQGDAFGLSPVRHHADRLAAVRPVVAAGFRDALETMRNPMAYVAPFCTERVERDAHRLDRLASAFADQDVQVSPIATALSVRLLSEPVTSPLYNDRLPVQRLDHILAAIEYGVHPRAN